MLKHCILDVSVPKPTGHYVTQLEKGLTQEQIQEVGFLSPADSIWAPKSPGLPPNRWLQRSARWTRCRRHGRRHGWDAWAPTPGAHAAGGAHGAQCAAAAAAGTTHTASWTLRHAEIIRRKKGLGYFRPFALIHKFERFNTNSCKIGFSSWGKKTCQSCSGTGGHTCHTLVSKYQPWVRQRPRVVHLDIGCLQSCAKAPPYGGYQAPYPPPGPPMAPMMYQAGLTDVEAIDFTWLDFCHRTNIQDARSTVSKWSYLLHLNPQEKAAYTK